MAYRVHGNAGDVYGSAGYERGQRVSAAHCRESFGERRREHLGAYVVSGIERNRVAADGMVFDTLGAKTLLHRMRSAVHG